MAYNSYFYVLFIAAAVFFYYVLPKRYRWVELLLVSILYYLICGRKYIVFLLFSTITIYGAGRWIEAFNLHYEQKKAGLSKDEKKIIRKKQESVKRLLLVGTVCLNIGVLIWRKYFTFLGTGLNIILSKLPGELSITPMTFILPLGISFYTLQALGYIIDVSRGKYPAEKNFGKIMLFLWFFPQMVEGPICRYDQTAEQLYTGHKFDYTKVMFGLQRLCFGMLKKVVIADRLDVIVNHIQSSYQSYNGALIVVVAVAYTLQLYAEFSGCMDMVLGSAEMFGVRLPENFDHPFAARTVAEYWRRWHMTLGTWFKDYVFYSVSLSKPVKNLSKKLKAWKNCHFTKLFSTLTALFAVWSLTGLWHGASSKYLLYGWYYFVIITAGILFEPRAAKLAERFHIDRNRKAYQWFQRGRTFIIVNIGLLLFRVGSTSQFFEMFSSMFRGFSLKVFFDGTILHLGLDYMDLLVLAVFVMVLMIVSTLQVRGIAVRERIAGLALPIRWMIYMGMVISTILFGAYGQGYASVGFIYANF